MFLLSDCARSLLSFLCPLQSLFYALSSGVSHNTTARIAASPISVPYRQPDLSVQYHQCSKVDIRGQPLLPHSMGREQGWATWELIRGLEYSGSSLPSCPSLSLDNLLYREDFPWSTYGVVRHKSWRLECVMIWKLSRKYYGEKQPSLSFPYSSMDAVQPRTSPNGTCWLYPTS